MMFVLSLIASPRGPGIESDVLRSTFDALEIADENVSWLADGMACDVSLRCEQGPDALLAQARAREVLEGEQIDANVIKTIGRRKRLLIADMDSTIIEQECIDELGIAAGAGDRIKVVTRRAMRGELDFVAALRERVSFMQGLPESVIRDVIDNHITFVAGGRTLVQTMKAHGAYCALISGGFEQFTAHVADMCGFDTHQANQLVIENDQLTGMVVEPALGGAAKVEALNRLTRQRGLAINDAVTVGDGANDIGMIGAAGLGVAMHAKPAVRDAATTIIDNGDLTALLYLQGYSDSEFKT